MAGLILLIGSQGLQDAIANGDTRTISLHHVHTGEDLTITFKRDGRYDDAALQKINWLLRDWRRDEATRMEPRLIDLLWEVHREVGAKEAIRIISAYRSPQTNAMLRRRRSGVAETSHHMGGNAIDFFIPDVPLEKLRVVGLRMQRGGVGYYPSSGSPFVHLDVGNVRHWPRMTHDQLARVFPDGRTVHIPQDGKPLPGYALALADIERRGGRPSGPSLAAARDAGVVGTQVASVEPAGPSRNLIDILFGRNNTSDGDRTASTTPRKPSGPTRLAAAPADTAPPAPPALPPRRPAAPSYQVASILPVPAPRPAAARPQAPTAQVAAVSANDVINARGYWKGIPDADPVTAALAARARTGLPNDRAPAELALAYAAHPETRADERPLPMGQAAARAIRTATPAARDSAPKDAARRTVPAPQPAAPFALAAATSVPAATRFDDPWLRALVVAPDVRSVMTVTAFGPTDYIRLAPLLRAPASAVMMTFAADPYFGMTSQRFGGEAIVFVSTVTFVPHQTTAALR